MTVAATGTPASTYRLQLRQGLDLAAAADLVTYLDALGVGALYSSPLFTAASGSTHGYDVTDPTTIDDGLGGRPALERLGEALQARRMGFVLDIVPNHMGIGDETNRWWQDVLRHGRESRYAPVFDVDWSHDKLRLPWLGEELDETIARGHVRLDDDGGSAALRVYDRKLPLRPGTAGGEVREVLAAQHYTLCSWKDPRGRSYRRFFDIDTLVGVRVEDDAVFDACHGLVLDLVRNGTVTGLRIDHPDGLRDPKGYLRRLKEKSSGVFVVIEKILEGDEQLDDDWLADGTTGYETLNALMRTFVDERGGAELHELHRAMTGNKSAWPDVVYESKKAVIGESLSSEVDSVVRAVAASSPSADAEALRRGIVELVASFPVYRTYSTDGVLGEADRALLSAALEAVKRRAPELPAGVLATLETLPAGALEKLQQVTGPAAAKGVEDTAFYRFYPLACLNEVGGQPTRIGAPVEELHRHFALRQKRSPGGLSTTSTHDTKRSEDVRARIAVLSERPAAWREAVTEWRRLNEPRRRGGAPSAAEEYLLYQTLVGTWPPGQPRATDDYRTRIAAYTTKALREAKVHTSWTRPDDAYENDVQLFVSSVLDEARSAPFLASLRRFVDRHAPAGLLASASQTLLKLAGPGVADIYQGCELWDFSLVDPDNRRPVDFSRRRQLLASIDRASDYRAMVDDPIDGRVKLLVTSRALRWRRAHAELCSRGDYEPVAARGPRGDQVVAFARRGARSACVAAATRFFTRFGDRAPYGEPAWQGTEIVGVEPGRYREVLTNRAIELDDVVSVARVFSQLPFALLERLA